MTGERIIEYIESHWDEFDVEYKAQEETIQEYSEAIDRAKTSEELSKGLSEKEIENTLTGIEDKKAEQKVLSKLKDKMTSHPRPPKSSAALQKRMKAFEQYAPEVVEKKVSENSKDKVKEIKAKVDNRRNLLYKANTWREVINRAEKFIENSQSERDRIIDVYTRKNSEGEIIRRGEDSVQYRNFESDLAANQEKKNKYENLLRENGLL